MRGYETVSIGAHSCAVGDSKRSEIRQIVDGSYDKIVQAMFAALKQMAKMDGEGEDKGQLNYHVIIIGIVLKEARKVHI